MECTKRKMRLVGAPPLTCRSIHNLRRGQNIGRILAERRVALMLHFERPGVEEAVGSHEVDLTSPISSRTISCPKRLPAQDIRIVSQLCFYAQEQIGNFHSSPSLSHPISWTRIFTNANTHIHKRGHAYSRSRICVFAHTDMHVHLDAPIKRRRQQTMPQGWRCAQGGSGRGAGSRPGHVKSDPPRGSHQRALRSVVALSERGDSRGRAMSRAELPALRPAAAQRIRAELPRT